MTETYQMQDVEMHAQLFMKMEPDMNGAQALNCGDFSRVTACYEWHGLPVDAGTAGRLERARTQIQNMIIGEMESEHSFGVYEFNEVDGQWHWSDQRFSELVHARAARPVAEDRQRAFLRGRS